MYRTIYMLESITNDGDLVYRLFAANKRTAEKLKRRHAGAPDPIIRKLSKQERHWVRIEDVERL